MDADSTGGAVTGAVLAAAVEKPAGKAGEHSHHCDDCGADVSGRFCSNCGQPAHTHRTLLHLGEEILHGVMHFDSRIWRTLPLLVVNPGRLTREWVLGKRTRYVSPLAMYLFDLCTLPLNLAGHCGMSVPSGLSPDDNLPVGLQIMAPALADDRLYRVGAAYEAARGALPTAL